MSFVATGRPLPVKELTITIASALLLGVLVAQSWVFALAVIAIPAALLCPVYVSLGLFAAVVPFDTISVLSGSDQSAGGTTLVYVVGAAAGAILIGTGMAWGRLERPPRAALWWTLLLTWAAMTALWAPNQATAIRRLATAFGLLLLYLAATSFRATKTELAIVSLMTQLGGVAASLYAISHHAALDRASNATISSTRMSLGETDPNVFAATLLLPLSLAIAGVLRPSAGMPQRVVRFAILAVMLVALLLTMSRGGLIAFLTVSFLLAYRFKVKWLTIGWFVLLFLLIVLAMPDLFFQRLENSVESRGAGRLDIWHVGFQQLKQYGLFGAGVDNFSVIYAKYAGEAPVFRGFRRVAHNIVLSTVVELGVPGLILLLSALRSHLWSAAKAIRTHGTVVKQAIAPYEAACWGLLVAGMALDLLWKKTFWLAWILLAMAVRTYEEGPDESA